MKKRIIEVLIIVLSAILLLEGCGRRTHKCKFNYPEDYIRAVECTVDGCEKTSRRKCETDSKDGYVFTFDDEKKEEIEQAYLSTVRALDEAEPYDEEAHGFDAESDYYRQNKEFEKIYDVFAGYCDYLDEQETYAYLDYCMDCVNNADNYESIADYSLEYTQRYYALFLKVYNTQFREYFFSYEDGWTDEDIQTTLDRSRLYSDEKLIALRKELDTVEMEYDALPDTDDGRVPELYGRFVQKQNEFAAFFGYDNYYEYAQKNVYGREYSTAEIIDIQSKIKKYISPKFSEWMASEEGISQNLVEALSLRDIAKALILNKNPQWYDDMLELTDSSVMTSALASDAVASYLERMSADGTEDFFDGADTLFKEGNYYYGNGKNAASKAFTVCIPNGSPVIYMEASSYADAYTFLHEYGHCYAYLTDTDTESFDISEIQSMGNEMLFLSYLESYTQSNGMTFYSYLEYYKIAEILMDAVLTSAVDEFERCVYTNDYDGNNDGRGIFADGISYDEYDELFASVLADYGLNEEDYGDYWRMVVIGSPCYYLSYSFSSLSVLELYAIAEEESFDSASAVYKNLFDKTVFTACEEGEEPFAEALLEAVGLHRYTDDELYSLIADIGKTD